MPAQAEKSSGIGNGGVFLVWTRGSTSTLGQEGQAASALEARVRQLEEQLRRTERERDILKKALAIFSQGT